MKKILFVLFLFAISNSYATSPTESVWKDYPLNEIRSFRPDITLQGQLKKRRLTLDEARLNNELRNSNLSARSASNEKNQIELPLPDGSFIAVEYTDSPILSDELSEQYPEIKTWSVRGVDDPSITGRIGFTSEGFHGMLTLGNGDTVYIDPEYNGSSNIYYSFSKKDNNSLFHTDFNCEVHDHHQNIIPDTLQTSSRVVLANAPALDRKTYRLAVAGTGEYTASQGGTTASAYASMVTTINRVNQIYQRDLGVSLQLVSGEDLIYTNAATDPYSNNSSASALVDDNITNMTNYGNSNFDLGHVFTRGSLGGLAYVGVACINSANGGALTSAKAGGATGISSPQGETFSIDYVAHEIGHQLGAGHTFNGTQNSCSGGNRSAATAVEPGSGSTIMSYSGICGSHNIQSRSDAMFHYVSINQVNGYVRGSAGNSCGTNTSTGNQNPVANAGGTINIPANTPFMLDGSATGGTTYTWDQIDAGSASAPNVDTGNNAIIRTFLPSGSQDRYIPSLSDLFSGSSTNGVITPRTTRDLNFMYVVRDGSGGIGTSSKTVNVTDTGSTFSVVSHSSNETLFTNQSINVLWNRAFTDVAPINCANVDIQLIRSNGTKNMLLASTSNDGSEVFNIPASTPTMTGARIMVGCSDNSFFNISSGNIAIQVGSGDLVPPVITVLGQNPVNVPFGSTYVDAGATANDDVDGSVTVTTSGTVNTNISGTYTINYSASDASGNTSTATRTVIVGPAPDTTPPVITLNGSSVINIIVGSTYNDAGATALDNVDGVVAVNSTGTVNTNVIGVYTITYTAVDAAGNSSSRNRTINVTATPLDTVPPVISINGASSINLEVGTNYVEAGATATDNVDGIIPVVITGTVNINVVGTYMVTYTAIDSSGNSTIVTRVVNIIASVTQAPDTQAPVITLNGSSVVNVEQGSAYIEFGANAFDTVDGGVTVIVSGAVNTNIIGSYTIVYTATDSAGNSSTKTRTVNVTNAPDTTPPVISLSGDVSITLQVGDEFIDDGFSAFDDRDGVVSVTVIGLDAVDTSIPGVYTIIYTAVDSAGNTITEERIITVEAASPPPGSSTNSSGSSSGGGSISYLLIPLGVLFAFRRRKDVLH